MRYWRICVRGPDDRELPTVKDLLEHPEEALRASDALQQQIEAFFAEMGHPITERGRGFGEWELGAIVGGDAAHELALAINTKFYKAWTNGLCKLFVWPSTRGLS